MDNNAASDEDLILARELVLRHGWNATAYQILNPGIRLWFSAARDAVAGYAEWGRVRVVAGAPICSLERLGDVAEELRRTTVTQGLRLCYFGAGTRLEGLLSRSGHVRVLIGAQPIWNPMERKGSLSDKASMRAQLNRARNKGVTIKEWPPERAAADPALRRRLDEWLADRNMPSMHFLVEPQTLDRLWDRRLFTAEIENKPVAFLVASPVPQRNGWLIEQIVRGDAAPNGSAEALVDAAFKTAAREGLTYFTLGLSPLSRFRRDPESLNPWWLDLVFHWLRAHAGRFYNFRGLEAFKAKFDPDEWEPIYLICDGPAFPPRILLAVAAVFGGRSPFVFVGLALWKSLRQEARWLGRKITALSRRRKK